MLDCESRLVSFPEKNTTQTAKQQLCRHLRSVISSSIILQYIIETAILGCVDIRQECMTKSRAIELMLSRRNNWKNMSFTTHERLPWASLIENAVVCGGLLARPFKSGPPEPHSPNHYNSLQIVDLFAQNHEVPSSTLHLPCDFRKFTMDRGQDLLVLVRFQGYVYFSLSLSFVHISINQSITEDSFV